MIIEKIKRETGIDVTIKSRRREQVDFKVLASYIMKAKGYSLTEIGKELNLKHCSIIHHLKIYPIVKKHNPRVEELENVILGKKKDLVFESFEKQIQEKNNEIKELKKQIERLKPNESINRLLVLLENEDIKEKFEAFLTINEKARYYKKYE